MNQPKIINFPFDDARKLNEAAHRDFCIQIIGQLTKFFIQTMEGNIAVFTSKAATNNSNNKIYDSYLEPLSNLTEILENAYDSDHFGLFFESKNCLIEINFDPTFFSVTIRQ